MMKIKEKAWLKRGNRSNQKERKTSYVSILRDISKFFRFLEIKNIQLIKGSG